MQRHRVLRELAVIAVIGPGIALLPGCRKAPEEEAPVVVAATPVPGEMPVAEILELPQSNVTVGITLEHAPEGLVATYNEHEWLELTDRTRPALRFTFEADLPDAPSRSPAALADFEILLGKLTQGQLVESGTIDTTLGAAEWAIGTYFEEDQSFADVRVFAPHPSGAGTLILYSVGPAGVATTEERLSLMKELLQGVS
jgi:hypothetical protein